MVSRAERASEILARADTGIKNQALQRMAALLEERCDEVIQANERDIKEAREAGIKGPLLDRLVFNKSKVQSRIASLKKIAALPDPVGQIFEQQRMPNGLVVGRMRVSLGVIFMIYEARPHVTVNAGAFSLKAGNAIICKGGSEVKYCNALLGQMWTEALESAGLPTDAIQVVSLSHEEVDELLKMHDRIALVIPRGGKDLIRAVSERSRIPVIKHFEGVCHVYIGDRADTEKALRIVLDSKLLMPAVCNAAETVLIDSSMRFWVPMLVNALMDNGIEVRGCPLVCQDVSGVQPAGEVDWYTEYLDKIYSVRVIKGLDEAVEHITRYGSGHTDAIVTENYSHAMRFMHEVDSSVVLVNASTMFCDGESLGMGAEIGISTDKFHARGPMGLNELTSYKHVIWGEGHIMGES
ncbi:MAG: glutamate-5-semialdehyde dehydrogenase [Deltaproteobacteria bacterium]|nr:glutamate-5-semialdehyde dehydrogenase [Deltaproteobacteria bacterium]